MINLKSCINQINICKYSDYHEYLSGSEKIILKLINKKMINIIFIFDGQCVLSWLIENIYYILLISSEYILLS